MPKSILKTYRWYEISQNNDGDNNNNNNNNNNERKNKFKRFQTWCTRGGKTAFFDPKKQKFNHFQ